MPTPTLFGFSESQLFAATGTLVAPVLAYLVLYVIGGAIKSVSFMSVELRAKIPSIALPLVTIFLASLMALFLSAALALKYLAPSPPVNDFNSQFHQNIGLLLPDGNQALEDIVYAEITLSEIEQLSNIRVFVNQRRLFGSGYHCRMIYQCNEQHPQTEQLALRAVAAASGLNNFLYPRDPYFLPIRLSFLEHLVEGQNTVDIHIENSGLNYCNLQGSLVLEFSNGRIVEHEISVFGNASWDRYRTWPTNNSYAVCDRARVQFALG